MKVLHLPWIEGLPDGHVVEIVGASPNVTDVLLVLCRDRREKYRLFVGPASQLDEVPVRRCETCRDGGTRIIETDDHTLRLPAPGSREPVSLDGQPVQILYPAPAAGGRTCQHCW